MQSKEAMRIEQAVHWRTVSETRTQLTLQCTKSTSDAASCARQQASVIWSFV